MMSVNAVAADATYGNGEFLQWLLDRSITLYLRTRDNALRKNNPGYGPERFTYLPESNRYRCPAGEQLNYVGLNVCNRAHAYIGSAKRCGACSQKAQCTSGRYKYLAIHVHESARQRARELANTPEFSQAQRARKKVEALFAELKNHIGLRRLRLRRMKFVRGTVLPGSSGAKHQATGAIPQRIDKTCSGGHHLTEAKKKGSQRVPHSPKDSLSLSFSTHTRYFNSCGPWRSRLIRCDARH